MPQWFALHGLQWSTLTVSRLLSTKRWWLRFITRYFWNSSKKTNGEEKNGKERKRPKFNIVQSIISFQKLKARNIEWQWIFLVIANAALCIQTLLAIWPEGKKGYEILVAGGWWRIDERSMNLHKFTAIHFILFHSHSRIKPSMHRNRFLIRWHIKRQIERWTSVFL